MRHAGSKGVASWPNLVECCQAHLEGEGGSPPYCQGTVPSGASPEYRVSRQGLLWGSHMSQKQQFGRLSRFLSRSMVSLVVGLLYVAACACPAVKVKNLGLELINGLLVSLGGKPDALRPRI